MAAQKRDEFGLIKRHREFADDYLLNSNGTKSYMVVYSVTDYNAAGVAACRLLKNPRIAAYITMRREQASKKVIYKYDVSKERIYKELERLAFYDMRHFEDEDGSPVPLHEMSNDAAAVVQGYKTDGKYNITEKRAALELLMKAEGLFEKHQRAGQNVLVIKVPDIDKDDDAGT